MLYLSSSDLHSILSSLMEKWCNSDIITDGAAMMVQQFCYGDFAIGYCRNEPPPPRAVSRGIFSGTVSRDILLLRKTLGTHIFPEYVPVYGSTSLLTMIHI